MYLVRKINLVYIKNDGSKVSFLEALEKIYNFKRTNKSYEFIFR